MRAVSNSFVDALNADERTLQQKTFIIFRTYESFCSSSDPALTSNTNIYNVNQVFDGRISTQDWLGQPRRFLTLQDANDGNPSITLDGTWFLLDDSGSFPLVQDYGLTTVLHTQEAGWVSPSMSDSLGNCDITLTVNLSSTCTINCLYFVGDPDWGYPVNCKFYVSQAGVKILVATVTGNSTYFIFQKLSQYYNADYIQIEITKWSRNTSHICCVEFVPFDGDDVTNRVIKWETLEERNFTQNQDLPYGNSSKNKLTMSLDNTDGVFYTRNMNSPYYRKLKLNTQFRLFLGLKLQNGTTEWTNRGKFYAIGNFATSLVKAEVDIEAWNMAEKLDRSKYDAPIIYKLSSTDPNTVIQLVDDVVSYYNHSFGTNLVVQDLTSMDDQGHYTSDWQNIFSFSSDSTIPFSGVTFAWLGGATYFQVLNDLCLAILGWVDVSEEETIIISTEFQSNKVFNALTNGDWENVISPSFGWTVGAGASMSYAPQNLVQNGTNSGLVYTSYQELGISQSISDNLGLIGNYTFQAGYNTFNGSFRAQVLGLDSTGLVHETYFNQVLSSSGSWRSLTMDFPIYGNYIQSIKVNFIQEGVAPTSFMIDNVIIATQAVYSFVGMLPSAANINDYLIPPPLSFSNINSQDIEDKYSVDKTVNQVTVAGVPLRLGLGDLVYSYDGNINVYYGSYFTGNPPTWVETIGLGRDDMRILLGRMQITDPSGSNYYAVVSGNDPTTSLYGPNVAASAVSGNWALLNTSYYYVATAINGNGESTIGPYTALSFPTGQQAAQITIPAIQDTTHFRLYRDITSFSGGTRSYIDIGIGTSFQAGWPSNIVLVATSPDNAGNPQLIFNDIQTYPATRAIPSSNTATKPPVIYLQSKPTMANGTIVPNSIVSYSFIAYPFESLHDQQQLADKSLVMQVGQSYSYNLTFNKTPVYITNSPTVWSYISPGHYTTIEGIDLTFDNLNDSGGAVSYIGLTLDTVNSQLKPGLGSLILINSGSGPLQPYNLHVQGPALQQTGGVQAIATDQASIDQLGLKNITITSNYIQSTPMATTIANRVLQRWTEQGLEYDIKMPNRAPLHLQIGDKISLWDDKNAIYGSQFLIVRIQTTYDGGANANVSIIACH